MELPTPQDRPQHVTPDAPPPAQTPPPPEATDASSPPLTPTAWLVNNGPYLLVILVGCILLYRSYGLSGLVDAAKVVLGLSFVVFIHELGHFLAAKWCDVHVQTFSIGFGPALPGCCFTWGETQYKIGVLPLGGYVNMVGEGPEADEEEDYPRSFKNKTVGQRMLIISAGVIMNILFGAICFIVVYRYHGVDRTPAIIWRTEAGSRAWQQGVRPGWALTHVDGKDDPYFEDMRLAVALSRGGRELPFTFKPRDGDAIEMNIEPLREENNMVPVIGVLPPPRLKLPKAHSRRKRTMPVGYSSAAAFARVIDLKPGDVLLACTDPKNNKVTSLPEGKKGWLELCRRMKQAENESLTLRVQRAGEEKTFTLEPVGFEFGDTIIGCTDPRTPDDPLKVSLLKSDPNRDPVKEEIKDPFDYRSRMIKLAGKPAVVQVMRADTQEVANILVPPAYHFTLGLRMKMGKVAAIRDDSPASSSGLVNGDIIEGVKLLYNGKRIHTIDVRTLDPIRLPDELLKYIENDEARSDVSKWRIVLTVPRTKDHKKNTPTDLNPMRWDDSWHPGEEAPLNTSAPMSIPQLGIAYWVESTILDVKKGSPADEAGLKPGDELREIRFSRAGDSKDADTSWDSWYDMASKRQGQKVFDQWAHFFYALQRGDFPIVEVRINRDGEKVEKEFGPIKAVEDTDWPLADRGLLLMNDTRRQRADTFVKAFNFGIEHTLNFIKNSYLSLSSMILGRISAKSIGGPIEIASQAFSVAGEDLWAFALFLGFISINLAVVNFLPIPVLDGGHMVFLIYEKLRGKPPSETVRAIATYAGLAVILALMIFVFTIDIQRRLLGMR